MKALHVLEFMWALFLLGFAVMAARYYQTAEMFVWALVIWITTLAAAGYSFWNWRSLWGAERKSASEYVRTYENCCLAGLRQIRFGYYFLAVQLAIVVPWISWKFFRREGADHFGVAAYAISMGSVAAMTAVYLFWFFRSRRKRLLELEQLRRYKESSTEE